MNGKYPSRKTRLSDCPLSATAPDWGALVNSLTTGTLKVPTVPFEFSLDPDTTKVIYTATGVLSGALLISAIVSRMK